MAGPTTVTGDVSITLGGKSIISRVDPIETATQVVDNTGAVTPNFFHTYKPLYGGSPGVRLDPVNGHIVQYPVTSGGVTTTRNIVLDIYNSFVAGYGPPSLTRYPTQVTTDHLGWFWNTPNANAIYPNVGHIGGETLDCQDRGGYTRQGDTSNNGTTLYTGGISPNDWGRQDSLPYTKMTGDSRNANPGVPNYYLTATDLYPVGVLTEVYQFGNLLRRYSTEYDRVYIGSAVAGGGESYIIDVQRTMEGNAVIQIPQTVSPSAPFGYYRGRNAVFNWDGRITATSTKITSTGANTENPVVQEPIASGQNTTYRVGTRRLYRNINDPGTSGNPPVPPPITSAALGDAAFALDVKMGVFVQWQSANGAAIEVPTGATVDFGINFADGSYYSYLSGTTHLAPDPFFGTDQAVIDPVACDYWNGEPNAISTKSPGTLRCQVTFQDQTYADGKHCPAFSFDSRVVQSGISYSITMQPVYTIQNPPLVIGNWTCNQPPTTIYSITITGSPPAASTAVSSACGAVDVMQVPELVLQNAPSTGQSNIVHYTSINAATSFTSYTVPALVGITSTDGATSPSLLIDPLTNQHRLFYMAGGSLYRLDALRRPAAAADWGTPVKITLSGYTLPCVVQHPRQGWKQLTMAAVRTTDSVTVDVLQSLDTGTSWSVVGIAAGTVAKSISRPAIAIDPNGIIYLGLTLANSIQVKKSLDFGKTWGPGVNAISVANANGTHGPNLAAFAGLLYLSALVSPTATNTTQPVQLTRSGDAGTTWSTPVAALTAQSGAISINPRSGRVFVNDTFHSDDQARTFIHN